MFKKLIITILNKFYNSIKNIFGSFENFSIKYPLIISISVFIYGLILISLKNYAIGISYVIISIIFYIILKSLKNRIQFIDTILAFTIVLILSFTLITFIISGLAVNFAPNEIRFGDIESWISFAGSVLGSSITMFALVFTMRHERLLREEDSKKVKENQIIANNEKTEMLKRSTMPIPLLTTSFGKEHFITNNNFLNFMIANKSKNGMFLRKITPLDSEFASTNLNTEEENCILFKPIVYLFGEQLIPSDCEIEFKISVLNEKEINYVILDNRDYRDEYNYDITLSFEVIFSDVLEIQEYSCIFIQKLKLIDESTSKELVYKYYDSYLSKSSIPKRV